MSYCCCNASSRVAPYSDNSITCRLVRSRHARRKPCSLCRVLTRPRNVFRPASTCQVLSADVGSALQCGGRATHHSGPIGSPFMNIADFNRRVVFISGGTSGVGLALVHAFSAAGATVVTCALCQMALEQLSRRLPQTICLCADVTTEDGRMLISETLRRHSLRLDVLVHAAAATTDADVAAGLLDSEAVKIEVQTNLLAPMLLTQQLLPLMPKRPPSGIVFIGSDPEVATSQRAPSSAAVKAGLHAFVLGLRHQLTPIGIRVVEVTPLPERLRRGASGSRLTNTPALVADATLRALLRGGHVVPTQRSVFAQWFWRLAQSFNTT